LLPCTCDLVPPSIKVKFQKHVILPGRADKIKQEMKIKNGPTRNGMSPLEDEML
jgi:hypothetical protein